MTLYEYKEKLRVLKKEHFEAEKRLHKEYAESNNPYKVGDIIEDSIGKARITSWKVVFIPVWREAPMLSYVCENLTKRGTINKRQPIRHIYQIELKKNADKTREQRPLSEELENGDTPTNTCTRQ